MSARTHLLAPLALLIASAALPVLAASSASSASSDSVSTSVGSVSTSFEKSSDSSSKGKDVAAGDYKVIEMAAAPNRPGMARMKLQAVAKTGAEGEFFLYLPQEAADQSRLQPGSVITANARPYGLEFAHASTATTTRKPFFLVLADEWFRELQTKVVSL
jgi:hypothetical protein